MMQICAFDRAALYGRRFRRSHRCLHPTADAPALRRLFDIGLRAMQDALAAFGALPHETPSGG